MMRARFFECQLRPEVMKKRREHVDLIWFGLVWRGLTLVGLNWLGLVWALHPMRQKKKRKKALHPMWHWIVKLHLPSAADGREKPLLPLTALFSQLFPAGISGSAPVLPTDANWAARQLASVGATVALMGYLINSCFPKLPSSPPHHLRSAASPCVSPHSNVLSCLPEQPLADKNPISDNLRAPGPQILDF